MALRPPVQAGGSDIPLVSPSHSGYQFQKGFVSSCGIHRRFAVGNTSSRTGDTDRRWRGANGDGQRRRNAPTSSKR